MRIDVPATTTSAIAKKLEKIREESGVIALSRVLTLVISTQSGFEEEAVQAANVASREHPCRIIVLVRGDKFGETKLDAQIRVGGDAGASEVILLYGSGRLAEESESAISGLLLPDSPIVVWWPHEAPTKVAYSELGRIAHRRITDAGNARDTLEALENLSNYYQAGDTDLAWTRTTSWRIQLAAIFDQLDPSTVEHITVAGATDSPSTVLLAAWLTRALKTPITINSAPRGSGIVAVRFSRANGDIVLSRSMGDVAQLYNPDDPVQHISMPKRTLADCLAEELRRLDPDETFGEVVRHGLPRTNLRSIRASER